MFHLWQRVVTTPEMGSFIGVVQEVGVDDREGHFLVRWNGGDAVANVVGEWVSGDVLRSYALLV